MTRSKLLCVSLALTVGILTYATAQGPLTPPPGPPAPVYKTLAQIEPRTDVATLAGDANAMIVIAQPGSYFLSGNITISGTRVGIAIAANDVTLDLQGFTINGSATAPAGIDFRGTLRSCRVHNGHIQNLPAGIGVRASGSGNRISQAAFEDLGIRSCDKGFDLDPVHDVRVERARVSNTTKNGIDLNTRGTVVNSQVDSVAGVSDESIAGIVADVVTDCQVSNIAGGFNSTGILAAQVTNCRLRSIGNSSTSTCVGIEGVQVRGCSVDTITGNQVTGISGRQVIESRVTGLSQTGGTAASLANGIQGTVVLDCHVTSLSAAVSTNLYGIAEYEECSRCRVGAISAMGGGATAYRPSGSSSRTIDCGASSITLNVAVDLANSTGALIRGCRFNLGGSGVGIACNGTDIRIEDNTITGASVGINAASSSTAGLIVRNRVTDCTVPISFNTATWQVGPRISAKGDITSTNPWANFID